MDIANRGPLIGSVAKPASILMRPASGWQVFVLGRDELGFWRSGGERVLRGRDRASEGKASAVFDYRREFSLTAGSV
jgi:hypothetical protein